MESLTQAISLRVVGCGAVQFDPQAVGHAVPQLGSELRARSEEMSDGVPNLATHVLMNARATSVVAVDVSGTASGQRVVLSTIVSRWVKPQEGGRGPTRSMFT